MPVIDSNVGPSSTSTSALTLETQLPCAFCDGVRSENEWTPVASVFTHAPRVLLTYLREGDDGLSRIAEQLHQEAHDQPEGKFSKRPALYLPQSPFPPFLWRTECERCRFWHEGGPGEAGRCHIVGREDDPFGGERIHPRGICGFYLPPEGEPAFGWINERLNPSGASTVRGEYRRTLDDRGIESTSETREREVPVTEKGHDDR